MATILYRNGKKGLAARIRVSGGYDQNGRQIVHSMTYHPPENLIGQALRQDVERAAARYEQSVLSGAALTDNTQTLEQFYGFFVRSRKDHLSVTTMHAYDQVMRTHILPHMGSARLCDIAPREIGRAHV